MNVSNSVSGVNYPATVSVLKSANKQPELALQLLMQSVSGMQSPQATAQTAASPVPAASGDGTGQMIDIMV